MKWRIAAASCAAAALIVGSVHGVRTAEDEEIASGRVVLKNGIELDVQSEARDMAAEMLVPEVPLLFQELAGVLPGGRVVPQVQLRGGNVQVNDPALDNIQTFTGFRPFIEFTQSETTVAGYGPNIVVSYNSSANQPLVSTGPGTVAYAQRFLSAFSTSNDGGRTWMSGFVPPAPGALATFGDGVVVNDRNGAFYYSGLGVSAAGTPTIQVNKSIDGGRTWSDASIVASDANGDKEWIAVGPDPFADRDNLYVTWTSFQSTGAQLRLGKSIDGGTTWATKTIFAPTANNNPLMPQNSLQFSQPVVDRFNGRLYVAFAQFSNADEDFIRVLVSDDGGDTFSFLNFNIGGAILPTVLPVVQSGHILDAGSGGTRLAIHAGPYLPGRFGLRQYQQVSRLVTQPAIAVRNGRVYLAWSSSTSLSFGDLASGSNVLFVRSDNGGATWSYPIQVNPAVADDVHHVLPFLAINEAGISVHVGYYTQHGTTESVDVDLANSHDRGDTFPDNRALRLTSESFVLPPTVIRLTAAATPTTNYDRTLTSGYSLGEYLGVAAANGSVYVAWGDARNAVTHPLNALDPLSGQTHSQQDAQFQRVKAQ